MLQLDLEKAEEPEIKLPTPVGLSKKQESSRNTSTSALLITPAFDCVDYSRLWKRWDYQNTWPSSWEICMKIKKQQLEPDMEQQTGSKWGEVYIKAVYCHPVYLTFMQSTSLKCQTGWSASGINIIRRNISNLRCADDTTLIAGSKEELKSLLKWERRVKKLA